jgi:hypothetical protein
VLLTLIVTSISAACRRSSETYRAAADAAPSTSPEATPGQKGSLVSDGPAPLADTDIVVRGITLGTHRVDVIARLGKADTTRFLGDWAYPGMIVVFDSDSVRAIRITDSTVATARGLRVGDAVGRLAKLYGLEGGPWNLVMFHVPGWEDRCLVADTSQERVEGIEIGSCPSGE